MRPNARGRGAPRPRGPRGARGAGPNARAAAPVPAARFLEIIRPLLHVMPEVAQAKMKVRGRAGPAAGPGRCAGGATAD